MMFSTSTYWYIIGQIRNAVSVSNFLIKYLNRKFTKKAINDAYIGYLLVNLPTS
jgi:hypothetical protein